MLPKRVGLKHRSEYLATAYGKGSGPGKEVMTVAKKSGTRKIGQSAITGRFMSVKAAKARKSTAIVRTIKKPSKRK